MLCLQLCGVLSAFHNLELENDPAPPGAGSCIRGLMMCDLTQRSVYNKGMLLHDLEVKRYESLA